MPQLLGSLILLLAAFLHFASAQTSCNAAPTASPTTASPASPPSSADSCWPPWSATLSYPGGSMASYEGKNWRAAWWTQGEDPATHTGVGQPWVLNSTCAPLPSPATRAPTAAPPTAAPTTAPTEAPTVAPTNAPTAAATKAPTVPRTEAPSPSNGKRVVGYFVEWGIYAAHNNYLVTNIPFNKLTHINYAFVGINPGTLAVEIYDPWASTDIVYAGESWDTTFKGNLGQLRKAKLAHPHVKVLISVGGWTKSHGFHTAAATPASRATAAANLVAFMKTHGLDGVDIDWEYPGVNRPADPTDPYDMGAPGGPEDKVNFTLFMAALRAELDRVGRLDGKHYELTAAVGIGYDKIAHTDPGQYIQYMDAINLMTYDMHGAFESNIGHQAPMYTNPYDTHEAEVKEKYTVDWAVNEFLRLGVPANKIVLGLPFYSRGWDNVSGGWDVDGNGTPDGMFGTGGGTLDGQWGPGGQGPYFAVKALEGTAGWEKFRDPYSKVPWLYNRNLKQLYTYDDGTSISAKLDYANSKGLGGAMYWELDGDAWQSGYDLVNIVAAKIL